MASCLNCKYLTNVNSKVISDRGQCVVWNNWQKTAAKNCKYFEQKIKSIKNNQ